MEPAYIQQRIHDILEGQIAMGGGVIAGVSDWISFLNLFRGIAEEEGIKISYKQAMQLASPVWRNLKVKMGVAEPMQKVQSTAARAWEKGIRYGPQPRAPRKAAPMRAPGTAASAKVLGKAPSPNPRPSHGFTLEDVYEEEPVTEEQVEDYVKEILGEGFSLKKLLKNADAVCDAMNIAVPVAKRALKKVKKGKGGAKAGGLSNIQKYHRALAKYKKEHPTLKHATAVKNFGKIWCRHKC